MQREKLLYALIGVLLGAILGYLGTDALNQKYATAVTTPPATNAAANNESAPESAAGEMQADVTATLERAQKEPQNFAAQVEAGKLYAQISRFDQAVAFLTQARKLNPKDEELLQLLTAALLSKGDKAAAREALQQLEKVNPKNAALSQLRSQLN
ncbi:MAG: tetratricopeptide repeat protein [Acidobacteria bacterium]|nr:tetratricopeptide repeat protein [Acidobacteriota bacterium]